MFQSRMDDWSVKDLVRSFRILIFGCLVFMLNVFYVMLHNTHFSFLLMSNFLSISIIHLG